ncbi:MAG: ABC transporter permease [Pseudomonadota bacterium]|nr:ABC transporter permease [Pseudomonadota bacterium]
MRSLFDAAMVIARRDFVATVWSKTFLLFLLAPVVAIAFGGLIGGFAGKSDAAATQPNVAIVADADSAAAIKVARDRLAATLGQTAMPMVVDVAPEEDVRGQAQRLLADGEANYSAVLTGTLAKPLLTAPQKASGGVANKMALILDDARRVAALRAAGVDPAQVTLTRADSAYSAGSLRTVRHALARGGQVLIFFLTILLAGMLLSNLVEEKSNKVIEILAAAVPLDAVFLGKLIAMLGVSIVGILMWGALAGIGLMLIQNMITVPVTPAVGWPAYCLLTILYFAANYLLLGAVFLGIGGQASNVREVQTLSMPITFAQLAIFFLAGTVVADDGGTMTWIAAVFPLSSPLAMMAIAAEKPELWVHLPALLWQLLWVALFIRGSAALFRRTVLKSGKAPSFFGAFRSKKV